MKRIAFLFLVAVLLCACGGNDYPVTILSMEVVDIDTDGQDACLNVKVTLEYAEAATDQYGCVAYIANGAEIDTEDFSAFVEDVNKTCNGSIDLEPTDELVTKEYLISILLTKERLEGVDLKNMQVYVCAFDADNSLLASEFDVAEANVEEIPVNDVSAGGNASAMGLGGFSAEDFKKEFMKSLVTGAIESLLGGGSGGSSGGFFGGGGGEGECDLCHGDGQCPYHSLAREEIDECDRCGGTNRCPKCDGRGTLDD